MEIEGLENRLEILWEQLLIWAPKLAGAILTLLIGLWVIKLLINQAEKVLTRKQVDPTLQGFLTNFLKVGLLVCLVIAVIGMVGIQTTSFMAVLASAGLAVGLALQGSLSNFAGGVVLLVFRPFRVGDYVEASGQGGTVREIRIFHTILQTPDNRIITLPNGVVANSNITNYSAESTRKVEFVIGTSYDDDIDKTKLTLKKIATEEKRVLQDQEIQIVVSALGDNAVEYKMRVWTATGDYWGVFFDVTEKIKKTFDEKGISFPFPQRDVHINWPEHLKEWKPNSDGRSQTNSTSPLS